MEMVIIKNFKFIFILGIILLLIGISWGVTVSGNSYNEMMQAKKVPPIVNLQNNNGRYRISLMGEDMVNSPPVKNPITPEKAKNLINKMSKVSKENRALNEIISETNRNLIKLWRGSYFSKANFEYSVIVTSIEAKIKPIKAIKQKLRNYIEIILPKNDK